MSGGARSLRIAAELHLLRREGLAVVVPLLLAVLLIGAALNARALVEVDARAGASLVEEAATTASALAQQAARGLEVATSAGSAGLSVLVAPAVLPAAPLAPLAVGQADLLASRYELTAKGAHHFLSRGELDNPLRLAAGNFDPAFVVVWLLPLFVIALTFNLVSAERERGTLAIALASGASLGQLVRIKLAARLLLVSVGLAVGLLAGAALGEVPLRSPATLASLAGWLLVALAYAAVWAGFALWFNARGGSSDGNAARLVGLWLAFVVLAPALTNLAATTAFPAPSRVMLTAELREATEAAEAAAAQARDRYFFDHPEMRGGELDLDEFHRSVAGAEVSIQAQMLPLLAAFEQRAEAQRRVVEWLQYLSPGTLAYGALTDLAGADGRRHATFRAQVIEFHRRWQSFFVTRIEAGTRLVAADYDRLPAFAFAEPPPAAAWRRTAAPLAALAGVAIVLLLLARRALPKVPIA